MPALRPYPDDHWVPLEVGYGLELQTGRRAASGHEPTFVACQRSVWKAAITGHSGPNVGNAWDNPPHERPDRFRRRYAPLLEIGLERPAQTGLCYGHGYLGRSKASNLPNLDFTSLDQRGAVQKPDSTMDWLTFVVEFTEAVIWPIAIICVGYVFKNEAKAMLLRLTEVKYKDFNATFSDGVVNVTMDAEGLVREASDPDQLKRISGVAAHDRIAAILLAWKEVEIALREALQVAGTNGRRSASNPMRMIDLLVTEEAIDEEFAHVLRELRKLRNVAAHASDYDISMDRTDDYIRLSLSVVDSLKSIAKK